MATENFAALCTGGKKAKGSGLPLHYTHSKFHRYAPGFILQGGDFVFGNGSGGESIWGKKFKDDTKGLKLKHDARGILSMGNSGKNSNGSQFFITLAPTPQCDKKHVVFGRIMHGLDVLDFVDEACSSSSSSSDNSKSNSDKKDTEEPLVPITITSCGEWKEGADAVAGHWNAADEFIPLSTP